MPPARQPQRQRMACTIKPREAMFFPLSISAVAKYSMLPVRLDLLQHQLRRHQLRPLQWRRRGGRHLVGPSPQGYGGPRLPRARPGRVRPRLQLQPLRGARVAGPKSGVRVQQHPPGRQPDASRNSQHSARSIKDVRRIFTLHDPCNSVTLWEVSGRGGRGSLSGNMPSGVSPSRCTPRREETVLRRGRAAKLAMTDFVAIGGSEAGRG